MAAKQDFILPEEFRKEIPSATGGYLLYGDEDYLKKNDIATARVKSVGEDDIFNCFRFNADNYSPDALASAIDSLPVMADKKFIELYDMRLGKLRTDDGLFTGLCEILSTVAGSPDTLLIFTVAAEELDDKPKHLGTLKKVLKSVRYDHLPPNRLITWIQRHFGAEGIFAPPEACRLLADISGNDMYTLAGEVCKLSALVKSAGKDRLEEGNVREAAGRNLDYDEFAFTDALLNRRTDRAFAILSDLKKKKEKPEKILSGINSTLCNIYSAKQLLTPGMTSDLVAAKMKIHPYRAKIYCSAASSVDGGRLEDLIAVCHRGDILIKNTALNPYTVLERLTAESLGI